MNEDFKNRLKGWLGLLTGAVFVVCLLSVVGFAAMLYMFTRDGCGNEIYREVTQPNGNLKAVYFQRDCGATTSFSSQVSIIPAKDELENNAGNVFVIDGNHGEAYITVELEWVGEDTLQITHWGKARVFRKEQQFKDVSVQYITYEELVDRHIRETGSNGR